ncbi:MULTISPECIES: RDD family protein [unclassified Streptomyces]|uniref:RDD family protein n=1 Tax=unclassified Streptomyces TaxID=2593676 RepID=UPI002E280FDB|nr:RDD family protein [Streptomyces sp. NBC_00306]
MSNDAPTPGQPPEDDPFLKKPQDPTPPSAGGPQEPPPGPPPGSGQGPPPGSPYGGQGGDPYGSGRPGAGDPYGGGGPGGPYGGGPGGPYGGGPGGPYGGVDPLAGMPPLAEFGRRFLARVIDALIVFIPLFLLSLIFGGWGVDANGDTWDDIAGDLNTGRQWLWSLISLVAYVGYDTLMVKRNGQTVGKKLMKLRVAMLNDGSVPDTGSSLLRAVVLWVPALVCCFCIWWLVIIITILTDKPYKQGLHDKAGKTVVVSAA